MNKFSNILKALIVIVFIFIALNPTTTTAQGGDAGPGYNPTGGSCRGGSVGQTWFDTCFGVSWQYYEYTEPDPAKRSDVHITGSANALGATIPASTCGQWDGFWHLGYERYTIGATVSADKSTGSQRGTYRLGGVAGYGGTTRFLDPSIPAFNLPTPTSSFNGARAISYGTMAQAQAAYIRFMSSADSATLAKFSSLPFGTGSNLGWFCGRPPGDPEGEVHSRSNVRIGNATYATSDWANKATGNTSGNATPSEVISVTFSHDMKYTGALPKDAITKHWSYQVGVTGASVSISPSPPTSASPGFFTTTDNSVKTVVASHTYNITMPDITSGTGTVTICERITYQDRAFDGTNWTGGESYSRACATITINATTPVLECPLPNSSYSVDKGGTQAASAVRNMSVGNAWQQTTESNHTAVVWAKPGDSVQFKHTLCFGAQAVRGSNNPGGNGSSTPSRTILPSVANSATIKAFTTPSTSANYLFGKTLTGNNSQSFSLTRGSELPSAVSGADERGNYFFTYYSPSQKIGNAAAKTYECPAGDRGFLESVNNGYQIPGFTNSTKPSGCKSLVASDVGKIVEQNLEWLDVKSWVNQYSSGGSTSCGCNNNNYTSPSILTTSYDTNTSGYSSGRHVLGCYSTGRCGCCGEYCTSCHTQYSTTDYWYHPISTTSNAGAIKKAQVKIPYNYSTSTSTSINNLGGVVFAGEDSNISASVTVNTRSDNPDVPGNYATISKPTSFEVVAFTVPASVGSMPSHLQGNNNYPGSSSSSACSYYGVSGGRCQSIRRENNVSLNDTGSLNGSSASLLSVSMNIPDLEVGTKYCVALAVFPSNSHNSVSRPLTNNDAMMDTGSTWNYSKASCVTIAKKPSVHFYNSDLYTKGGISTSLSEKKVSSNIPGNNTPCNFSSATRYSSGNCGASDSDKNRRVFGSWAEYSVLAKKTIKNFASGAAFGYERNNGGSYSTPGGYVDVSYQSEPNACTYSTQTFNNAACREKTLGTATINPANINLDRLLARYTSSTSPAIRSTGPNYSIDLSGSCILGADSKYFPSKDGYSQYAGASYTCLSNGSKYIKIDGDARTSSSGAWSCLGAANDHDTRTVVIDVSGNLTINNNFMYGNSTSSGCSPATYTNISELPQLLIFAKNINIADNVTNIDAWLIANKGQGTINTCSSVTGYSQLDSTKCANQLRINGPVFAGKLLLNRTYGALSGNNSILAAEIFNLRNDAYYWSYSQAQRFSQSVTVYSSELAPRF